MAESRDHRPARSKTLRTLLHSAWNGGFSSVLPSFFMKKKLSCDSKKPGLRQATYHTTKRNRASS